MVPNYPCSQAPPSFVCGESLGTRLIPGILIFLQAIEELKQKLLDFRKKFRQTLGSPSLDYVTVSGTQVTNHMVQLPSYHHIYPPPDLPPSLVPRLALNKRR